MIVTLDRLLTLTGSSGHGKTRLALHLAGQEVESDCEGVWFVESALVQEATMVPQLVTNIFNVLERPHEARTTVLTRNLRPAACRSCC